MDFTSKEFAVGYGVLMFFVVFRAIRKKEQQRQSHTPLLRVVLTAFAASLACTAAVFVTEPLISRFLSGLKTWVATGNF